jgi:hypothetical protein
MSVSERTSNSLRISRQCFLLRACALQSTLSGLMISASDMGERAVETE